MKRNKLIWFISLLFCCTGLVAQNGTISGTIMDASNSETLIGVSVVVKGTNRSTLSDLDGNYTISAAPGETLLFRYIGCKPQEVKVSNQKEINVLMESLSQDLDEVVVVGTIMKKSDLTGAVSSVSSKVLEEKPVTNINQALQGRVAGVFISNAAKPGDDASIKIRGINTINTSTDPIYVVDGLVMDNFGGGFNSINLNDVESIQILKDASATALYGSRASNGVVLVTTKKGRTGEGKVSYDGWFGFQTDAKLPKTMGTKDLFELRLDAAMNSFKARYPNASEAEIQNFYNNRVMNPYTGKEEGGYVFAPYEFDSYKNNFNSDWLDEVTRTGMEQNHNVSFAGGTDRGSYYLSFGYADKKGMVKNLSDKKYSGRINADHLIKPWLKVGTNSSFTRSQSEIFENDNVYDKARGANPMLPVDPDIYVLNYGGFPDQNYFNPIRTLQIDYDRRRNRFVSSNFLNINPIKGLNIRTTFAIDYLEEARFKYIPKDIQESVRYSQDGLAEHNRDYRMTWQWDNSVSYDASFGDHRINGLFSTSTTQVDRDYTTATGKGFGTDEFSYYNIGASYKLNERSIGSDFTTSSLMSYVLRANYNYANKYYLTATARYDGSSKFAKGNQWGLFPSFSASWNMTEENFMKDQTIFDQLKIRAGYGLVGNQNIDDFAFLTLYEPKVDGDKITYVPKGRRGTKNITWESQRQVNVGVDMAFLDNRIRFSADAFYIKNKDLLMTRSLPLTSGFKEAVENIGAIENKGIEFSVDARIIETNDFQWNVSANISADRNKVTQLYGDNDAIYKINDDRNLEKEGNLFIGESRNTIYIWKTGGIAQAVDMDRLSQIDFAGRDVNPGDLYPLDVDGNKVIDDRDRIIVGSPDPKFYGGFSTDFTYKGITLNAVFNYSCGGKKLSPYYESLITSNGRSIASVDLRDRWSPENTGAKFPKPIFNDPADDTKSYNTFSASQMDHSVQDASFLRLSTLSLAYTFPYKMVKDLKLSNLRVYTTASNLFCITPYKGYDPETGDWYPPTRMFVFGLNVSF
jgi:TonB-linked outer membrane protein, SusC/RagA family